MIRKLFRKLLDKNSKTKYFLNNIAPSTVSFIRNWMNAELEGFFYAKS